MKLILLLVLLFLAAGIYLLLSGLLHLPSMASTKAALMITQKPKQARGLQAAVNRLSSGVSERIHLSPYKRRTMEATLKYAGIGLTPESYYARILVKAVLCILPGIACLFFFPVGSIFFVLLAIRQIMQGTHEAEKIVGKKRAAIESELPRFTETAAQELEGSRDVLSILEGYRESAGPLFRSELEITIAEMKSGSQEQALQNLSGRAGSAMLSQVVRGLLGAVRGGNEVLYFNILANNFQNRESRLLEKKILKRPDQMRKYYYLMLICFLAMYGYVLAVQIFSMAGSLF